MIDYVEIRNGETRILLGIIDTAQSVIWKSVYYGVGEFEIYAAATERNLALLQIGNFVTRKNDINCGIIDKIDITDDEQSGMMIAASGKFAKNILSQRITYRTYPDFMGRAFAQTLSGNLQEAVWTLINNNCGTGTTTYRQFPKFGRGSINYIPQKIVDANGNSSSVQTTYDNLLTFTDELLQEYGVGAYVWLDTFTSELLYVMYQGANRTLGNSDGNRPLVFSEEFDNVTGANYSYNLTPKKTTALVGGEGEGSNRYFSSFGGLVSGYERREFFVDASNISRTVKESDGESSELPEVTYLQMLANEGKRQTANNVAEESFSVVIDLSNSRLKYGDDFWLGDLVSIVSRCIGRTMTARVLSVTEVQDENGYKIEIECGGG